MTRLPPNELASLRKSLIEEQERLLAEYRRDLAAARAIQPGGAEDFEDHASIEIDRDLLHSLSDQERETLRLIEEALRRMDEGTYGVCQLTGEPIPLERLRQVPWARYVERIQERIELGEIAERPRVPHGR